jgi:hypothetical protein
MESNGKHVTLDGKNGELSDQARFIGANPARTASIRFIN